MYRWSRSRRRLLAALAASLVATLAGAAPASASCLAPPSVPVAMEAADLVFVGTVTQLSSDDRWATFEVDEVWEGPRQSRFVEVRGGPAEGATSIDRTYQPGTRYLVFAQGVGDGEMAEIYGDGARWVDDACSSTQPYTSALEQFRPAQLRGLTSDASPSEVRPEVPPVLPDTTIEGDGIGVAIILVGTVVAFTYAYLSLVRRRPAPSRPSGRRPS